MLRGYRFLVAAACGLALIVTLGTGVFFGSLYSPSHKQYQTVAGNHSGQSDYTGPSQSLPDISGLPGPFERAIANPHPATGQDHEKRDLAAQEASALWAFWMVVASFGSVLITAVGTIFLYKQIVLTREAVQDTGLATEAMQEANRIARFAQSAQRNESRKIRFREITELKRVSEAEQRQLRAYIGVIKWQQITESGRQIFEISIKNFGQTPAVNLKVVRSLKVGTNSDFESLEITQAGGVHLAPGNVWERIPAKMPASKSPAIYLAEIRYFDVFGCEWGLRLKYLRDVAGVWTTADEGTHEYKVEKH